MRGIDSMPALLFEAQLSGFAQSLPFALLPMACLMLDWSYGDLCWLRQLKMSLWRDSFCVLTAREIGLLISTPPGEDAASIAWKGFHGHAYFFIGWRGFASVICIWPLLAALTRKLPPSLI